MADPQTIETICVHLANGGDLFELCKTWSVRYGDVVMYCNRPEHQKNFVAALDARNEWAIQRILSELHGLAFVDIRDIFDDNHKLLPPKDWPDNVAKAIAGIDVFEEYEKDRDGAMELSGYVKKVKLYDKLKSIELLGKDLGRFISKHEVTGRLTLEDLVTSSNKKEQ